MQITRKTLKAEISLIRAVALLQFKGPEAWATTTSSELAAFLFTPETPLSPVSLLFDDILAAEITNTLKYGGLEIFVRGRRLRLRIDGVLASQPLVGGTLWLQQNPPTEAWDKLETGLQRACWQPQENV